MSVPAGGHASNEQLLKLAPLVSPDRLVTGNQDKLPDVGGKQINSVLSISFFSDIQLFCHEYLRKNCFESISWSISKKKVTSSKLVTLLFFY